MTDHEDRGDLILELFGELDDPGRADLEERLRRSAALREERERLRRVIERYRSEGEEEPPELELAAVMWSGRGGERRAARRTRPPREVASRVAALLLVAAIAFVAGRVSRRPEPVGPGGERGDLHALAVEMARLRHRVTALAMRQERATERIAAVEEAGARARSDPRLAASLWRSLRDDPSANVRLAAVDALYSAPEIAPRSADFGRLLASEPEASIRLALVGWLATARPAGWEEALRVASESDRSAAVRSRARELLAGAA